MSKNLLVWTDIPVKDLARAMEFYSKVLDGKVAKQSFGDMEFATLPHVDEGGISGCLTVAPDNQPSRSGPLLYLSVEGRLDAAAKAVEENGGEVLLPKHPIGPYGYRAIIADSEGNRIALHSPTA